MHPAMTICSLGLLLFRAPKAASHAVFESVRATQDMVPSTDSGLPFWHAARPVYANKGSHGEPCERYRTEIRSRWTEENLYILFICPYETLNLKPSPNTAAETFQLWDWDVAEAFIGSDFENIQRYKEFEISPQGEWVDLDIDLTKSHHEEGWKWKSGFSVASRIDASAQIWYGAMRIPFAALPRQDKPCGSIYFAARVQSQTASRSHGSPL